MKKEERKRLTRILIKLAPIAVAYTTGTAKGAIGNAPVEVPMSMIEDAAAGMRDLKIMLYGRHQEEKAS